MRKLLIEDITRMEGVPVEFTQARIREQEAERARQAAAELSTDNKAEEKTKGNQHPENKTSLMQICPQYFSGRTAKIKKPR